MSKATLKFMGWACEHAYHVSLAEATPAAVLCLVEGTSNPPITLKVVNEHRAFHGVTEVVAPLGHRAYSPDKAKVNVRYYLPNSTEGYKKWVLERLHKRYPNWGVEVLADPNRGGKDLVVTGLPQGEVEHVRKYVNDLWFHYNI